MKKKSDFFFSRVRFDQIRISFSCSRGRHWKGKTLFFFCWIYPIDEIPARVGNPIKSIDPLLFSLRSYEKEKGKMHYVAFWDSRSREISAHESFLLRSKGAVKGRERKKKWGFAGQGSGFESTSYGRLSLSKR